MRRPQGQTWATRRQHLGVLASAGDGFATSRYSRSGARVRASSPVAPDMAGALGARSCCPSRGAAVPAFAIAPARARMRCLRLREIQLVDGGETAMRNYCHKCQVTLNYFRAHK
jgi:hypothetical protein